MQDVFKRIYGLILRSNHVLLVTHPRPDGDALGSLCSMVGFLHFINKKHTAFCVDSVPEHFRYLPWSEEITNQLPGLHEHPDLIIVLDLPDWERAGIDSFVERLGKRQFTIAILDHHTGSTSPADVLCVDPTYSSTAELLYHFFQSVNFSPSSQIANALLTGLLTDTENFTNPATSNRSLETAGALMRHGANFDKLTEATWRFRKFDEMRLMGLVLNRLTYNEKLGLAIAVITRQDQQSLRLGEDPFTGFPNFLKGLTKGNAVLLLVEDEGKIKGSLRSVNRNIDVQKIAELFGGGGHKLAAGFVIPGRFEALEEGGWKIV